MKKKENQLQTDSAPEKKGKKKSGCLVVVAPTVIIGAIATAGGNSSSDSKTASSVASLEGAETEIMWNLLQNLYPFLNPILPTWWTT